MGGTMRLGARRTTFESDGYGMQGGRKTLTSVLYAGMASVEERHRHRYEVNPDVVPELEKSGLQVRGGRGAGGGPCWSKGLRMQRQVQLGAVCGCGCAVRCVAVAVAVAQCGAW